jgi:Zn-dependent protease
MLLDQLLSGHPDWSFILSWLVAVTIAITFHEFAHAKRADMAGDLTPRLNGRVTLNPVAHYDPIGSTMFLLWGLGWAKPVPINPLAFRHLRRDTIMVSLWGVLSNFILAALFAIPLRLGVIGDDSYIKLVHIIVYLNLALGVFNLIPLPPLDGSHVLAMMLPLRKQQRLEAFYARNQRWLLLGVLLILFVRPLSALVFGVIQLPILGLFVLLTGQLPHF